MLGKNLSTNQTDQKGVPVNSLLIEELINIKREIYFSIIMDPSNKTPTIITSPEGGMEIEELAQKASEKLFFEPVDPLLGLQSFQIRQLGIKLKLSKNEFANFSRALKLSNQVEQNLLIFWMWGEEHQKKKSKKHLKSF